MNDVSDEAPYFGLCRSLHNSVNPMHTITLGTADDQFIKFMINLRTFKGDIEDEETMTMTTSDAPRAIPSNLTLLPFKEYGKLTKKILI